MVVGHVAPEAYVGGTIALVEEGDSITIDAHRLLIQLNVADAELARRRAGWRRRRRATRAVFSPSIGGWCRRPASAPSPTANSKRWARVHFRSRA
jgi:dihydroxyacid dehydratase/phosphogluconate dehydratase